MKRSTIAILLDMSERSVGRVLRRWRDTGEIYPPTGNNAKRRIIMDPREMEVIQYSTIVIIVLTLTVSFC